MSGIDLNLPIVPPDIGSTVPDVPKNISAADAKKIDEVSKDFEAVFLTQMMAPMFAGDDVSNYFGGGVAGDVYKNLMLNEYGKSIAQSGGIGIADQVKKELLKLQEVAS